MHYEQDFYARWSDMDFNQHMGNAAYLGCAEETRMGFLSSSGWTMAEFSSRALGPVVVEDRLTYRSELRLLEPFVVDLQIAGITDDARKMLVRNTFRRPNDETEIAAVNSVVLWFDLSARRPVAPPSDLADLWLSLDRTIDAVDL